MRAPAFGLIGFGAVAGAVLLFAAIGAPSGHAPPPVVAPTSAPAPDPSVTGGGVTLASTAIALPDDAATYPAGPHVDVMDRNCTACHSATMVTSQPPMSAEAWKGEVTKMREVYKAPVPDAAVPAILAYLTAMPGQVSAAKP